MFKISSAYVQIFKIVLSVLLVGLLVVFSITSTRRGKTIKVKELRIEQLMSQRDSLINSIQKLGAEDVLTVNVSFNLKQTNVLSFSNNNCQQVAKEVATLTRQELLNMKDSLYQVENKEITE